MKKLTIVACAALLLSTAAVNAQTDTVPKQPQQQPAAMDTTATAMQKPVSKDKYNNWSADTYKMQPMPEALTTEKIFPVIGKYQLTDKEGAQSTVTISLDPNNKGIAWIEGLPQGKIKATLRKSPATYKIPVQPLGEEGEVAAVTETEVKEKDAKTKTQVKKAKELPEGVLIYDKDANVLNVCIGCAYNAEDPAVAFTTPAEPVVEEKVEKKTTKTSKKSKAKVAKVKPVHYTGNKLMETTATTTTETQQQQ
jgi:hypothetical protein